MVLFHKIASCILLHHEFHYKLKCLQKGDLVNVHCTKKSLPFMCSPQQTLKFRQLSVILRDKFASDQFAILWVKLEKPNAKWNNPSILQYTTLKSAAFSFSNMYVKKQVKVVSNFNILQWYLGYTVETAARRNMSTEGLHQLPTSIFSTLLTGGSSTLWTAQLQLLRTRNSSLSVHYLSIMLRIHLRSCFCSVLLRSCCFCPI